MDLLSEQVNTTGPRGKLLLGVFGAVAEFETELRRERQMEGVAKAKAKAKAKAAGKYKGRKPLKAERVEKLKALVRAGSSISAAAREAGVSRVTANKYLWRGLEPSRFLQSGRVSVSIPLEPLHKRWLC